MVSALDSGFEPWPGHFAVFLGFTLTVPLSTRSINGYQQTVRET